MSSWKKSIPLLLILSFSLLVYFTGIYRVISLESLRLHHAEIQNFINHHYFLFLFLFAFIYILAVGLSIPIATALTLAAGFFLGQWIGTALVVISATLGASIVFLSAKLASQEFLREKAGPWLKKMQVGFQENALSYLLTLRLIPLFPFVVINFAAAFFQISFKTFFWGTLIGIIPGSAIYVSIGVAMRAIISSPELSINLALKPEILFALTGLAILSLLPVFYKKFSKEKD